LTGRVDEPRRREASSIIAYLLAGQNLDAATRYAASLAGTPAEAAAFAGIIDQLALSNNPTEARAVWDALPETIRSDDMLLFARGNALRDADPATALASLTSIQDPQYRKLALVGFAKSVEARSPGAAIQAVMNSGLAANGVETHVSRMLRTWSVHDAAAARVFVASADWLSNEQRTRWLALIDQAPAP
jgi:hypothetical protein